MPLSERGILRFLMQSRERISVAVQDAHVTEDIFQKAVTKDVEFEAEAALLSWPFITVHRDRLNWVSRHRRELGISSPPASLGLQY